MNLAEQKKEALREAEAMGITVTVSEGGFYLVESVDNFTFAELQIYLDGYRDGSRGSKEWR